MSKMGLRLTAAINRVAEVRPALGALLGVLLITLPLSVIGLFLVSSARRWLAITVGTTLFGWAVTVPNIVRARRNLRGPP